MTILYPHFDIIFIKVIFGVRKKQLSRHLFLMDPFHFYGFLVLSLLFMKFDAGNLIFDPYKMLFLKMY